MFTNTKWLLDVKKMIWMIRHLKFSNENNENNLNSISFLSIFFLFLFLLHFTPLQSSFLLPLILFSFFFLLHKCIIKHLVSWISVSLMIATCTYIKQHINCFDWIGLDSMPSHSMLLLVILCYSICYMLEILEILEILLKNISFFCVKNTKSILTNRNFYL